MKLIESKTLNSTTAIIEFMDIPQNFTDLKLLIFARSSYSPSCDLVSMRFNNISTGYSSRRLYGVAPTGVGTDTSAGSTLVNLGPISSSGMTANSFGSIECLIPNYTSNIDKSFSANGVAPDNGPYPQIEINNGTWNNTQAITRITLDLIQGGDYLAGSTVSLYGILKGSIPGITVS